MYYAEITYNKHKFFTPSRKIELYSETLEENGYDPIPKHVEPSRSPFSTPEFFKKYPVILTTGARISEYSHSQLRGVPSLEKTAPEALAEIHPETAAKYGLSDGDMAHIETKKGGMDIKLATTKDLHPEIISVPHGWAKTNVNDLTELEPRDPVTGYTEMKALLCNIKKVE
jgi:anaerobic selenocysteine-containing dehydrogenase